MKKPKQKIIGLLFSCILLFTACQKDELPTPIQNGQTAQQLSETLRAQFDAKQFSHTLKYQYEVDWSNPTKSYSAQLKAAFYEFPIRYTDAYNPDEFQKQTKRDLFEKYKVVAMPNKDGKFDFFMAEYFLNNTPANAGLNLKSLSLNANKGYDGTVHLYDKNAELVFAKHVKANTETNKFYSSINKQNAATAKNIEVCQTTTIYHYIDWYKVWYDGYGNIVSTQFLRTEFLGTTQKQECHTEWEPDPVYRPSSPTPIFKIDYDTQIACPKGYKSNGKGGCTEDKLLPFDDAALPTIDFIDDSQLDPCPKEVMQQLRSAKNFDINTILSKLGGFQLYNVTMVMGKMEVENGGNAGAVAQTKRKAANDYVITLNNEAYTNTTKLHKAATILHELIHAYMLSVVDDYKKYPTNAPFKDFPQLFAKFVNGDTAIGLGFAHHEDMANRYVNAIASALEEYYLNSGFLVTSIERQAFSDLAWIGLHKTPAFNKEFPPGSEALERVMNRIVAEQSGRPVEEGTLKEQKPIGAPCN